MRKSFCLLVLILLISLVSCSIFTADTEEEGSGKENLELGIWNFGYVGADTDPDHPLAICDGDGEYLYSDIIELGKAGTKITVIVENPTFDVKEILTISF